MQAGLVQATGQELCVHMTCFIAETLTYDVHHPSTHHVRRLVLYSKR